MEKRQRRRRRRWKRQRRQHVTFTRWLNWLPITSTFSKNATKGKISAGKRNAFAKTWKSKFRIQKRLPSSQPPEQLEAPFLWRCAEEGWNSALKDNLMYASKRKCLNANTSFPNKKEFSQKCFFEIQRCCQNRWSWIWWWTFKLDQMDKQKRLDREKSQKYEDEKHSGRKNFDLSPADIFLVSKDWVLNWKDWKVGTFEVGDCSCNYQLDKFQL